MLEYNILMEEKYEWDETKRASNIEKHEIDFADAENFDWDTAAYEKVQREDEIRFVATGYIHGRLHIAVYTMRDDLKRIISLRKANPRERRRYEQSHRRRP